MQLVPRSSNHPTEVEALVEKRERLPFGPFICLFLSHQGFDFLSKQAANRGIPAGGENFGLLEYLPAKAYGDVLLGFFAGNSHPSESSSRKIRVTRVARVVNAALTCPGQRNFIRFSSRFSLACLRRVRPYSYQRKKLLF